MSNAIELILADDHKIMRDGLSALLEPERDLHVVAQASNGPEALECIESRRPDVAVVDYSMPGLDGVGVIEETRNRGIDTAIVILTMHKERGLARRALDAGAAAVVLKDDAFDDLVRAIHAAFEGDSFVSEALDDRHRGGSGGDSSPANGDLTPREREVLAWIARGRSNKEVAAELFISVKTVETHRAHIMEKLDLHNTAELVRYAVRAGIVPA